MIYRIFPRPRKSASPGKWLAAGKAYYSPTEADDARRALKGGGRGFVVVRTHLTAIHTDELLEMLSSGPFESEDGSRYYTVPQW